ncbi:ferric reductase transmembrane component-like protein 1 [Elsinoe australis]|uniref:Ferric reductase transmembrane component-like protein 1 n=1 Tax=Elsinoe australis TaxID=40998 RepID=A0A4U7B813_9PEZI|nr:ferric reductase transmembrane component-like protein 1 [Elsinoe australis]
MANIKSPRAVIIGTQSYTYEPYDVYFWFGILTVVFLAACVTRLQDLKLWLRLRRIAAGGSIISKPTSIFGRTAAYITQLLRSVSYTQATPASSAFTVPTLGTSLMITSYIAFLLALQFYPPTKGLTSSGYRAGWLAVAQFPLLIALINKNNIITHLTKTSYERLNILHRWVARSLLLLATLHLAFLYRAFAPTTPGGILHLDFVSKPCVPTGLAAYALLIWMNISTLAPIRAWCYELFILQHVLSWLGLITCVIIHVPSSDEPRTLIYVWLPLALYIADKLLRAVRLAHRNRRACPTATLEPFAADEAECTEGFTKIVIPNPGFQKWSPGAHVLLSFPSFAPGESHPATIVSTPKSHGGDVVCLLKAETGFTRILSRYTTGMDEDAAVAKTAKVLVDGPYASGVPSMAGFESVVFVAAGTGVTYTLPLLQGLAERIAGGNAVLPVRKVKFVWVVRSLSMVKTLLGEVAGAVKRIDSKGVDVSVVVYVTGKGEGRGLESRGTDGTGSIGEDEMVVMKAFTPVMATREASVVADTYDIEKGEWRVYAVRMQSVAGLANDGPRLAEVRKGRPDLEEVIGDVVKEAEGEVGAVACGPIGFTRDVRNQVAGLGWRGKAGAGVYLWVEGQGA